MIRRSGLIVLILCLLLALYGCGSGGASTGGSKPPNPTPGQSGAITLTSSARVVNIGNTIPITAKVLDSSGRGIPGVAIVFMSTGVGTMNTNYQLTDNDGNAAATIFSTAPGTSSVTAFSNNMSSSLAVYFLTGAIQNQLTVAIDSNGNNIYNEPADYIVSTTSGAMSKIRVTFTDAVGTPLVGKTITLSTDSSLVTLSATTLTTDNTGNAYTWASFANPAGGPLANTIFIDITASASGGSVGSIALQIQPYIVGSLQFYSDSYYIATGGAANLTACLVGSNDSPLAIANLGISFAVSPGRAGTMMPVVFTDSSGCAKNVFTSITPGTSTVTASFMSITSNFNLNAYQAAQPLHVTPPSASVSAGDSVIFMLTGGAPPYSIISVTPSLTNPSSWNVAASGGTFEVTGVKAGDASMLVTDSSGVQTQIPLTITASSAQPSTLAATPSSVSLALGQPQLIVVTGGVPPYTATSLSPSLTTPTSWNIPQSGGALQVTGVSAGTALLNIVDSTGAQIQATVTITASSATALTTTPQAVSLLMGEPQVIVVSGGVPPYTVTSLNPSLTNPTSWDVSQSGGSFQVTGSASGNATLAVVDSAGKIAQVSLAISSNPPPTKSTLTATPSSASVILGQPQVFVVTGGTAPYTATSLSPTLTDSASWNFSQSGGSFQVTGVNPGTALINVVDSTGSQIQVTFNVTTSQSTSLLATPQTAPLAVGEPQIIVVTGGTPPYTVTSLNPSLTDPDTWSVTSSGGSFEVTPQAAGTALINIVDSKGTQIQATLTIQ